MKKLLNLKTLFPLFFTLLTLSNSLYADISIEAINETFNYKKNKHITTKIVNSPFNIKLVLIDQASRVNIPYQAWQYNNTVSYKPMPVIVTLQESLGMPPNRPLNNPAITLFTQGVKDTLVTMIPLNKAHRKKKLKMAYLDWKNLLDSVNPSSYCLTNISDSIYLNGMPACLDTPTNVEDIFPKLKFPAVTLCFWEGIPTGKKSACDTNAYTIEGNPKSTSTIFPDVYNHSYGCYHCVAQNIPNFNNESFDNFAVRPNFFELNSSNPSFPDLLHSGQEYNFSLKALDAEGNATQNYNTSKHNLTKGSLTLYLKDNTSVSSIEMKGDFNISEDSNFNISNGIAHKISPPNTMTPEDVLGLTFSDVGKINMQIIDQNWALVDQNDTPNNCNATPKINNISVEASTYICGDINATFIPHHFEVTSTLKNHRDGNFTYYANKNINFPMSAHVKVKIVAKNAKDQTTKNFKKGLYENNMTVELNVTDWNTTLRTNIDAYESNTSLPKSYKRTNVDIKDINTSIFLGFSNGEYTIETNATLDKKIMFNYTRTYNAPKNPLELNGRELNITVTSNYIGIALESPVDIKSSITAEGNATFFYARVRPSKSFYPNVTANSKQTPILIDVYCDLGYDKCQTLGIDIVNAEINQRNWWLSLPHNQTNGDGNVTLSVTSPTTLSPTKVNITSNAEKNSIVVDSTSDGIVDVNLDITSITDTNLWLIYNPDENSTPTPFYQVEFIGTSDWTGYGTTGHVVDSNASKKRNNRLGW